ncbi:hypothetical protein P175DRAFT_0203302 [Aspergillus ochraceoroseus IBT 24754]|uniref:Protein kinase domain-containing protein n=1 Tax=Aspergillus ochraceoroseus IBT 24754 TaxID=1392256 RepID=A0A2T5M015_9EURO|nr:uncharacterized protein P175DRAFT_0203302 [Aspergillus ochraceoroseus IBT 24754]PTU21863.1 hypothetical protein P175DRAFT_0203302 [Aspergillus ochraceoroseus IBT 24754]
MFLLALPYHNLKHSEGSPLRLVNKSQTVGLLCKFIKSRGIKIRMSSILAGASGRVYVRDKVLRAHPKRPELNIYRAHLFPSQSSFEQSLTLKRGCPDTNQLRTHVDANEDELVLVYEYFEHDLLSLVRKNSNLPLRARKIDYIFQDVGDGQWRGSTLNH